MFKLINKSNKSGGWGYRSISLFVAITFTLTLVIPPSSLSAQTLPQPLFNLPAPGTMVSLSGEFSPTIVKGLTIHPDNPLEFDFIVDTGDEDLDEAAFKAEAGKLIKYFLASLTVPEGEMWVNLSPYEKERVIPEGLGVTELGRDLLTQDYLLKQLTASLIYPEDELGQKFWTKIRHIALERYGVTDIPMETFNKVWIVPDKAVVYEYNGSVFVVERHLKVMLEEDYVAVKANGSSVVSIPSSERNTKSSSVVGIPSSVEKPNTNDGIRNTGYGIRKTSSEILQELILPALEHEVNHGKNFAKLRQIYNSMILATWFKKNLRDGLIGRVYVDQNKTKGVDLEDKNIKQKVYDQYIEAFKKGVYNYIKEDYDPASRQLIPRKYFSGGLVGVGQAMLVEIKGPPEQQSPAVISRIVTSRGTYRGVHWAVGESPSDPVQIAALQQEAVNDNSRLADAAMVGDLDRLIEEGYQRGREFIDAQLSAASRALDMFFEETNGPERYVFRPMEALGMIIQEVAIPSDLGESAFHVFFPGMPLRGGEISLQVLVSYSQNQMGEIFVNIPDMPNHYVRIGSDNMPEGPKFLSVREYFRARSPQEMRRDVEVQREAVQLLGETQENRPRKLFRSLGWNREKLDRILKSGNQVLDHLLLGTNGDMPVLNSEMISLPFKETMEGTVGFFDHKRNLIFEEWTSSETEENLNDDIELIAHEIAHGQFQQAWRRLSPVSQSVILQEFKQRHPQFFERIALYPEYAHYEGNDEKKLEELVAHMVGLVARGRDRIEILRRDDDGTLVKFIDESILQADVAVLRGKEFRLLPSLNEEVQRDRSDGAMVSSADVNAALLISLAQRQTTVMEDLKNEIEDTQMVLEINGKKLPVRLEAIWSSSYAFGAIETQKHIVVRSMIEPDVLTDFPELAPVFQIEPHEKFSPPLGSLGQVVYTVGVEPDRSGLYLLVEENQSSLGFLKSGTLAAFRRPLNIWIQSQHEHMIQLARKHGINNVYALSGSVVQKTWPKVRRRTVDEFYREPYRDPIRWKTAEIPTPFFLSEQRDYGRTIPVFKYVGEVTVNEKTVVEMEDEAAENPLKFLAEDLVLRQFVEQVMIKRYTQWGLPADLVLQVIQFLLEYSSDLEAARQNVYQKVVDFKTDARWQEAYEVNYHGSGGKYATTYRQIRSHIRQLPAGAVIMDVGAGSMALGKEMALDNPDKEIIGTDPYDYHEEHGIGNLAFRLQPDPLEIPGENPGTVAEDNSADAIVMNAVLHHVSPEFMDAFLKEIYRVLKPGGVVLLVEDTYSEILPVENDEADNELTAELLRLVHEHGDEFARQYLAVNDWWSNILVQGYTGMPMPYNFHSTEDWQAIFARHGLSLSHAQHHGFLRETFHKPDVGVLVFSKPLSRAGDTAMAGGEIDERSLEQIKALVLDLYPMPEHATSAMTDYFYNRISLRTAVEIILLSTEKIPDEEAARAVLAAAKISIQHRLNQGGMSGIMLRLLGDVTDDPRDLILKDRADLNAEEVDTILQKAVFFFEDSIPEEDVEITIDMIKPLGLSERSHEIIVHFIQGKTYTLDKASELLLKEDGNVFSDFKRAKAFLVSTKLRAKYQLSGAGRSIFEEILLDEEGADLKDFIALLKMMTEFGPTVIDFDDVPMPLELKNQLRQAFAAELGIEIPLQTADEELESRDFTLEELMEQRIVKAIGEARMLFNNFEFVDSEQTGDDAMVGENTSITSAQGSEAVGGIDLNAAMMDLQIKRDGRGGAVAAAATVH
jgi:SAM-dependent methyltransferase